MNVNHTLLFSSLLFSGTAMFAAASGAKAVYPGYRLLEKRFIKEINAECLYLEHLKSGARVFKIAAADPNKTFAVAFRTIPDSDAGTPHILEHSVLDGSRKFPAKSPFSLLAKGSLSTFLNAMTGDDYTVYPAASMNGKDYFNLMEVYLDAVFHPLIYERPRIFMQEGWHYELSAPDAPLTCKGVVYNEMKGAYSNPTQQLYTLTDKNLFPDNNYRFSSGGDPQAIPSLTNEQFLDFHRRYYHPSNAYILLYGDADLAGELAFLDARLSQFDRRDVKIEFQPQKPFKKMKEVVAAYSVPENSSPTGQSYLSLAWVVGNGTDRELLLQLRILAEALVRNESAPLRQALRTAGIGLDYQAHPTGNSLQCAFQIVVRSANPGERKKFRDVVLKTLEEVVKNGLDKKMLEGIVNREEFALREDNDAQKGLKYGFSLMPWWLATGNPFAGLEYETALARLKRDVVAGALEDLIRNRLLVNPHGLLLELNAEPGRENRADQARAAELAELKAKMSKKEIAALVKNTGELIADQQQPDSPAALASIPMLTRADLNPQALWYDTKTGKTDGVPFWHYNTFTAGVVYLRLAFDLRGVPAELLPYAALLRELLGSFDTDHYSFGDLDNSLNRETGGFDCAISNYLEQRDDQRLAPRFTVAVKALATKAGPAFALAGEIVNHSRYRQQARIRELLSRLLSRLDAQLKSDGLGYASKRLQSYYSRRGVFDETIGGLDYYRFVKELNDNFDARFDELSEHLARTAALIFSRRHLVVAATCSEAELPAVTAALKTLLPTLPDTEVTPQTWKFVPTVKNEALMAASKVQFVLKGGSFKLAGYRWNGKMMLLSRLISSDWLWNRLRVVGGAYGGFCSITPDGNLILASYRDPNLKETLDNFDAVPDYLARLKLDERELTRYLIGAVARLDQPLSPSAAGDLAFRRRFEQTTKAVIQRDRDELLSITPSDPDTFAPLVRKVMDADIICVYGNEEKLKNGKALFKHLVPLQTESAQ